MKNIGVERGLTNISDFLSSQGYKVKEIDVHQKSTKDFLDGFDAVVINGFDDNIMGIQTAMAKTSIIDASGLTPRGVKEALEQRLQ